MEGTPPGDALPPPPQRAKPARKGARCGAGAGSPRPHRPQPGHTGRRTPAALPRGRAAGLGTAPDTRRPSQRWQADPPGDGPPPPPRHAAPTGHAGQGDSVGPPHRHTRAHSTGVVDPNSPSSGRAVGGGGAPDLRRPSQRWKAPPPGMPFRHPHSEQRRPARTHAVGTVLGPHASTDRIRDTRVAEPRPPAPEDGRPGKGQRLTPDARHNGGRPPPPRTAPHNPRGTQPPQGMQARGTVFGPHTHTPAPTACGWQTPTDRPVGGQFREGERLTTDAPDNDGRHPPGNALPPPPQRATPARRGARCGAGAGYPRPHRPHPGHTGRGTPAVRPRGRAAGEGTAPDTRRPSQQWQATPPADGPPPPPRHAAPTGHAGQGDSVGPPRPHTRAHSTWVADPNSPPSGRAVGGGGAPDLRRPSQRWKAPRPGMPFRHPHSEQRRPARAHAVGAVLGPHARSDRTRDTRLAEHRLPALEDGRPGGGQRLTPDAPHNSGRPAPPRGRPLNHPRGTQPPQGVQAKPGRGEPGPDRPPRSTPDRARDRGRRRGGARTTWKGPTSAKCRDRARCARHSTHGGGGGECRGSASARTRKGHAGTIRRATGPSSRKAQTAWNGLPASEGKGHPDVTARHKQRGTRGWEGGNGRDTTPGTGPSLPNRPRAPRTHGWGTASAKAVVAHCATPQPLG